MYHFCLGTNYRNVTVPSTVKRLIIWMRRRLKHQQVVLALSVVVGLCSGLVAVVLKNSVHFIQQLITGQLMGSFFTYLYIVYPLIGILLTVTVVKRYLFNKPIGHGIPNVLYAISRRNAIIKRIGLVNSLVTSAITVGFGGSVGLEGPTVGTSAAFGSNIGRLFNLNYKTKTTLIGCAAAGAMASMFSAPIAAIVFAIEVMMLDLTTASLIPLLLASVSAALTSKFFLGDTVLFHFELAGEMGYRDLPFYIMLGVVAGFFSIYIARIYFLLSRRFDRMKAMYPKAITGGILLGLLLFVMPPLYGEGYETVNALINGQSESLLKNSLFESFASEYWAVIAFLVAIGLFKMIATTVTFSTGGVGGIFAPALFMGSVCGYVFSSVVNRLGLGAVSTSNFTLVGMAGLMGGVLHAPLTAIFLIAEITGGYELFIPLMITTSIAYLTTRSFTPHSIYTAQLARRGELITHHKDQAVLTLMRLQSEIERDFQGVHPEYTLGDLVKVVAQSHRNIFPVVDAENRFLGMVNLNDIREIMFNPEMYDDTRVKDLMVVPPAHVSPNDGMDSVMEKFEKTEAWNLPVVDDGKYVGFVSKSKLFSAYRNLLKEFYED